jgi:hypothetical protein
MSFGSTMRHTYALALSLATAAQAAIGAPVEQVVGGIDAMVFVCTPIDPKSAHTGAELLERARAQHKLDLPSIRKTGSYRSVYNAEVNRLLALPPKDRVAACQSAW